MKKVFEDPPVEQVLINICATKADWTLEEYDHELSPMQHIYAFTCAPKPGLAKPG